MKKRIIILFVSVALLLPLSSCNGIYNTGVTQSADYNNTVEYTVRNQQLSSAEQQVAAGAGMDIWESFIFQKNRTYEININFYKHGNNEITFGTRRVYTNENDEIIRITGNDKENGDFIWGIEIGNEIYNYIPTERISGEFMTVGGTGQENFVMEEGKEYSLVYFAYKEGTELPTNLTAPLHIWDTIEDKEGALAAFDYAYVVTVQLV